MGVFLLVVCLFLFGNSVNALCPYNQIVSLVVICFSLSKIFNLIVIYFSVFSFHLFTIILCLNG